MIQASATQQGINQIADDNAIRPLSLDHWRGAKARPTWTPRTGGAARWPPAVPFSIGQAFSSKDPRIDLTSAPPDNPSTFTVPSDAGMQNDERDYEQEKDWQQRLRSLQECICELLIQNQQLRMSLLDSATNHQSRETD